MAAVMTETGLEGRLAQQRAAVAKLLAESQGVDKTLQTERDTKRILVAAKRKTDLPTELLVARLELSRLEVEDLTAKVAQAGQEERQYRLGELGDVKEAEAAVKAAQARLVAAQRESYAKEAHRRALSDQLRRARTQAEDLEIELRGLADPGPVMHALNARNRREAASDVRRAA